MQAPAVISSRSVTRDLNLTDLFCGCGGSTSGAERAGLKAALAINHWQRAVDTHNLNFPHAAHDCADIQATPPTRYWATDVLLASPSCVNHSLAKGVRRHQQVDLFGNNAPDPAAVRSRATMWNVVDFAEQWNYKAVIVENVVEAGKWILFPSWLNAMQNLGYDYEIVYFNSQFAHPTPQSRDRLYCVFWKKGNPKPDLAIKPRAWCPKCERDVDATQVWKNGKAWGKYKTQYNYCCPHCSRPGKLTIVHPYFHPAAEAIDWSLECPRIGGRKTPLMPNTLKRIQIGLDKFYGKAFMADMIHTPRDAGQSMVFPITTPCRTILGQTTHGVILPPEALLVDMGFTADQNRTRTTAEPMATQTARQNMALVLPTEGMVVDLAFSNGDDRARPITEPIATQTTAQTMALVLPYYSNGKAETPAEPLSTVTSVQRHGVLTAPFILGYYTRPAGIQAALSGIDEPMPTQSAQPRHYLVRPAEIPKIEDCGYRMLRPHEIKKAMAFGDDYVMPANTPQRDAVAMYGNAVTPPVMELLANRVAATLQ